ncbi:hypothetical protein AVEN_136649-1 [Araneus ventricosus]|uniref:Uncharacterized protein n=1 Tax=Araneus ventricosus TaxID=182803 RepID=A0A4Y2C9H7_ARAVE|nr:hypothetical protein AVEN_136649-1 [Araneus ventricosus]
MGGIKPCFTVDVVLEVGINLSHHCLHVLDATYHTPQKPTSLSTICPCSHTGGPYSHAILLQKKKSRKKRRKEEQIRAAICRPRSIRRVMLIRRMKDESTSTVTADGREEPSFDTIDAFSFWPTHGCAGQLYWKTNLAGV